MVATRNHPSDFQDSPAPTPSPESSPRKRTSARTSTTNNATSPTKRTSSPPPTISRATRPTSSNTTSKPSSAIWSHTPSNLTLLWLAISLPLVTWDTGYILLRPYTMPGGALHWPLWVPYALYGTIDHTYGFRAYNAGEGWPWAQGSLNLLETLAYGFYLYLVYTYGEHESGVQGTGAPDKEKVEGLGEKVRGLSEARTVHGRVAGMAVLVAYTAAQITFWKTVLYWLVEVFNGFEGIGHNDAITMFFMWIIPNGAWLILPGYMMYVFGAEILQGLDSAASGKMR